MKSTCDQERNYTITWDSGITVWCTSQDYRGCLYLLFCECARNYQHIENKRFLVCCSGMGYPGKLVYVRTAVEENLPLSQTVCGTFNPHDGGVTCMASADEVLATAGDDGAIKVCAAQKIKRLLNLLSIDIWSLPRKRNLHYYITAAGVECRQNSWALRQTTTVIYRYIVWHPDALLCHSLFLVRHSFRPSRFCTRSITTTCYW